MVRAPFYDQNGLKRGEWSPEEDDKLKSYIQKYGYCNWRELPKFAGLLRCGKSCRLRWMNYLRPDVKRGNYSKEEEELIIKLHQKHGNKWSKIAADLPGRTDNEIKNYWHTRIKKLLKTKTASNSQTSRSSKSASKTRNISLAAELTPQSSILESFPVSPLASESSNFCCKQEFASRIDMVEGESPAPTLKFEAMDKDFWAQPFIPNNFDGEFTLAAYALAYVDAEDLFYQAMKELPGNSQLYQ